MWRIILYLNSIYDQQSCVKDTKYMLIFSLWFVQIFNIVCITDHRQ